MPGSSGNSSFIPKRGTSKHKRKIHKGKVYSLTIVSYVLLFAALAASAAVYVYSGVVRGELQSEAKAMNEAVGVFKEADMKRVQEFDGRLQQAKQRLNNSASISSIFDALEKATIDTVRFDKFSLARELDDNYVLQILIETDSFDSSIFQRSLYGDQPIDAIEINDLQIREIVSEESVSTNRAVNFETFLLVPLSAVPYQANSPESTERSSEPDVQIQPPAEVVETVADPEVESEEEVSDNQAGV